MKATKNNPKTVFKIAGAFIAWLIGSGFATGQEILQFFTSYGYASYGIIFINLIGFLLLGRVILTTGNEQQGSSFDQFTYYCGKKLGKLYSWLIPITLVLIISVMISAAGSALDEYYGVNRHLGSALMALVVVGAYLVGFEKLVKIVSFIGPVIIVFALLVGLLTIGNDMGSFTKIAQYQETLAPAQAAPHWLLSAFLYLSLCFFTASTYYTALGKSAGNIKEAQAGATLGAMVFILALSIISTAILLNGNEASNLEIPTLYLASKISPLLGGMFSVILVLGMFSSSSTMMWTVCNRFYVDDIQKNRMFAIAIGIITFILGQFSFSKLVSIFYPFVGYVGLIFIGCVIWQGIKRGRAK